MQNLNKFMIWKAVKSVIFQKMDNHLIEAERADQILASVQEELLKITNKPQERVFLKDVMGKFPELKSVAIKYEMRDLEILDQQKCARVCRLIENGNFEDADNLFKKLTKKQNVQL